MGTLRDHLRDAHGWTDNDFAADAAEGVDGFTVHGRDHAGVTGLRGEGVGEVEATDRAHARLRARRPDGGA